MFRSVGQKKRWRHTDEISILEVESVELIAGLLSIHHIFVYDESRAFCVIGDALADLAVSIISSMYDTMALRAASDRSCNLPNGSELPK